MLKAQNLGKGTVLNQILINKKGQALVEFVIILPIIMMIIFVIIDFSNVFYQKNYLENVTNDIVRLKERGKTDEYVKEKIDKDIKITYRTDGDLKRLVVSKDIVLVTPFSNMFFKNPFKIKTERIVFYE